MNNRGGGPCTPGGARRHRRAVADEDRGRIKGLLPGRAGRRGVTAKDDRLSVDAAPWVAKTAAPWRDLPERFGNDGSARRRFDRWARRGARQKASEAWPGPDLGWLILDSTVAGARPPARRRRKKGAGIADKGYDEEALVEAIEAPGGGAVVATPSNRKGQRQIDRERHEGRDLAERFWHEVEPFRRAATRHGETARNSLAFAHVASIRSLLG